MLQLYMEKIVVCNRKWNIVRYSCVFGCNNKHINGKEQEYILNKNGSYKFYQ